MLAFAPAIHFPALAAEEGHIASASDLPYFIVYLKTFDQDRRVLEPDRIPNAKLSILVGSHGVHMLAICDETRMLISAGKQANRRIIRAVLGKSVSLIARKFDSET